MPQAQRESMRMTDDEVEAYLENSIRLQFATIGRDGAPHVVPVNYTMVHGYIAFWTDTESQKAANLRRDPRVTVLVEDGTEFAELRGVMMTGKGHIHEDIETRRAVGEGYLRRFPGEVPDHVRQATMALADVRIAILVEPERIVSWDHRKLAKGARAED